MNALQQWLAALAPRLGKHRAQAELGAALAGGAGSGVTAEQALVAAGLFAPEEAAELTAQPDTGACEQMTDLVIARASACAFVSDDDAAEVAKVCNEAIQAAEQSGAAMLDVQPRASLRLCPALIRLSRRAEAMTNLRRDVGSSDLVQRIDLAAAEVDRLSRMLNVYLSAARHSPEPLQRVDLHALVAELVALLRYQVPEHVQLECCVPADLAAQLPRDRIRQALDKVSTSVVLCDAHYQIIYTNDTAQAMFRSSVEVLSI